MGVRATALIAWIGSDPVGPADVELLGRVQVFCRQLTGIRGVEGQLIGDRLLAAQCETDLGEIAGGAGCQSIGGPVGRAVEI